MSEYNWLSYPIQLTIPGQVSEQSYPDGMFACAKCRKYRGKLICADNVFIAYEGADLSHCLHFERERRCTPP